LHNKYVCKQFNKKVQLEQANVQITQVKITARFMYQEFKMKGSMKWKPCWQVSCIKNVIGNYYTTIIGIKRITSVPNN